MSLRTTDPEKRKRQIQRERDRQERSARRWQAKQEAELRQAIEDGTFEYPERTPLPPISDKKRAAKKATDAYKKSRRECEAADLLEDLGAIRTDYGRHTPFWPRAVKLDPHHILPQSKTGPDLAWNLLAVSRPAHEYIETFPTVPRVLFGLCAKYPEGVPRQVMRDLHKCWGRDPLAAFQSARDNGELDDVGGVCLVPLADDVLYFQPPTEG
ncbi:hypothetical protein [Alienimonas sp. DA493]|uniref:hypothetical protein n=1 Tax=Alienimonas sp. DA493 TaxID=3373605 RepID=UPI0037550CF7